MEGILLVHDHGHPHLLLLKVGGQLFRLPGGRLRPGEDGEQGNTVYSLDTLCTLRHNTFEKEAECFI